MRVPSELSESLLDLIYDAATEPSLWPAVLAAVADLCESEGSILFGVSMTEGVVAFEHNARLDPDCSTAFRERHMMNDWSLYMQEQPVGEIVVSDRVMPLDRLRRTAFYDDVLRPQSVTRNAMVALARHDSYRAAFNLCRTERQGPFEAHHLALLARAVPHLKRSLGLAHRLAGYRALQDGREHALERLSTGVVLLDGRGTVLYANAAAEALLAARRGIAVVAGALACTHPSDRRRLEASWQAVASGTPAATMQVASGGDTLTLTLSSVRGRDRDRFLSLAATTPAVQVFIADSRTVAELPAARLQAAFGLSPAEARVALAAAGGTRVADIAQALQLSPNTVKTHLSHVFGKMAVSRRSELVRRLEAVAQVRSSAGD